jgi:uncharacterized protein
MGTIAVRVTPRSPRPGIEVRGDVVVIRVPAPPVDGRATEAARRALAGALGVAASSVRLRAGATSRDKAFEVDGVTAAEALARLNARA